MATSIPSKRLGIWIFLAAFAARPVGAQPVDDATRATARQLGAAGIEAYRNGDFATSSAKLEKAYQLVPVPTVGLWSARASVQQGRLIEASERYRQVIASRVALGDVDAQKQAQEEAAAELAALNSKIPKLVIVVAPENAADVVVRIDGVQVPSAIINEARFTNPGHHVVDAERGGEHYQSSVELAPGATSTLRFQFTTAAAVPPVLLQQSGSAAGASIDDADRHALGDHKGSHFVLGGGVVAGTGGNGLLLGIGLGPGVSVGIVRKLDFRAMGHLSIGHDTGAAWYDISTSGSLRYNLSEVYAVEVGVRLGITSVLDFADHRQPTFAIGPQLSLLSLCLGTDHSFEVTLWHALEHRSFDDDWLFQTGISLTHVWLS